MSGNLIAYWRKWCDEEVIIPITPDGYIFKYGIYNQNSNEGNYDWVCCTSKKKLYAFIKYFILPSIQLSRTIGIKENTVCPFVLDYDDTIAYLVNSKLDDYQEHIETYKRWFNEIDILEKAGAEFSEIRKYITKVCLDVDYRKHIYVELDVFENISSVGKTLIEDYEEDEVLDVLELEMEMDKEQILELFNNIDSNKFMMEKITTLMSNRIM